MKHAAWSLIAVVALPLGGAAVAADRSEAESVTVHSVDMRGKPPFRRSVETLSVTEAARLERSAPAQRYAPTGETVTVRTVDYSGRPPFKRRSETLDVAEVARLEAVASEQEEQVRSVDYSGRPPFRRHGR